MNRAFTTREKILLVILAVLLIGIGYFKLILEPINSSIETYQSNTAAEQDEILLNTVTLAQMKMMQTELDEIHASGNAKPLPSYDNSDKLLVELNQILDKSDFFLVQIFLCKHQSNIRSLHQLYRQQRHQPR